MKKKLIPLILALVCAVACAYGLAACNNDNSGTAQHFVSTEWESNEVEHWNPCTAAGCSDRFNTGPHNFVNGKCICGRVKPTNMPTDEHSWSQAWSGDQNTHWHECTDEDCHQIRDLEPHNFVDGKCLCGQGLLYFELNSDKESYILKGIAGKSYPDAEVTVSEITIPETYKDKPVTVIGECALAFCSGITSIVIPNSITSIEREAFRSCISLKSVTIPDSVTSIDWAFDACPIESATIPARWAKYVAHHSEQSTLKTVVITSGDKIESYSFENCAKLTSITIPDSVKSIEGAAFYGCTSLESIIIPDGVTSIGYSAFVGCTSLASITLTNNVTDIGREAFNSCTALSSVTLSNSLKRIEAGVFGGCTSLESITIPDGVTTIGDYAFWGCTSLASITMPDSVTKIDREVFEETAWLNNQANGIVYAGKVAYTYKGETADVTSLSIKAGTKGIAGKAFYECEELTSVTLPDGLLSIGASAFYGSKLTDINFPDSLESIGGWAFDNTPWYSNQPEGLIYAGNVAYRYKGYLSNTNSITIQDGTKGIAGSAFGSGCQNLNNVTIPNSVTNIGEYAFSGCHSLNYLNIGTGVTSIGYQAFYGCPISTAYIPAIAIEHVVGTELESVTIKSGDSIKDYAFKGCTNLKRVELSDSVTSIGIGAFEGCTSLANYLDSRDFQISHIKLGNGITSIGDYAFKGCTTLEQLDIPAGVTYIGKGVFDGCRSLAKISVDENNSNYSSQDGILYNKDKTEVLLIPKNIGVDTNGKITVPEGIRRIGDDMFRDCNKIKEITFEANIEGIGAHAFDGCTKLERITFNGTIIQWRTFSKGEGWNDNTGDYTVICNDGSIRKSDS